MIKRLIRRLIFSFPLLLITASPVKASIQNVAIPIIADIPPKVSCIVTGCSSQLCADQSIGPVNSTCEWREEYACLSSAICEVQSSGSCGWTDTHEYNACIGTVEIPSTTPLPTKTPVIISLPTTTPIPIEIVKPIYTPTPTAKIIDGANDIAKLTPTNTSTPLSWEHNNSQKPSSLVNLINEKEEKTMLVHKEVQMKTTTQQQKEKVFPPLLSEIIVSKNLFQDLNQRFRSFYKRLNLLFISF